jgi:hydrogenase maturation protease
LSESGLGGSAKPRLLVLGVGNTLLGDDGVGYCLVRAIRDCGGVEGARLAAVQMINPGHVDLLEGVDYVVFIDAYLSEDMPEDADLAIVELDPSKLDSLDAALAIEGIDPHNIDPLKLMVLARATGSFQGRGVLLGVKPERIEFNRGLSDRVRMRALKALHKLDEILGGKGAKLRADTDCVARWLGERCRGPLLD